MIRLAERSQSSLFLKLLRKCLGLAATLSLGWFGFALYAFQLAPSSALSGSADAVVVLAGSPSDRLSTAQRHVEAGVSSVLLISTAESDYQPDPHQCQPQLTDVRVLCFVPSPENTRGEAQGIAKAIKQHGWNSVVVVTSRYHATRAAVLVSQCTSAKVQVVASNPSLDFDNWVWMSVQESAGLVDAMIRPECSQ